MTSAVYYGCKSTNQSFNQCFITELKKKDRERELQEKKIKELQEMRRKQEEDVANKDIGRVA